MLHARREQRIHGLQVDLLDFDVVGQYGRVDRVLQVLSASLHHVVELVALRNEQYLDGTWMSIKNSTKVVQQK